MVHVDINRLKGNYGASFIQHILSEKCLVRPVAEGTDIGVDLYCESVTGRGEPFLHFWVQVKTGNVNINEENNTAAWSFERKHLEYWARQPVPVFAFLVPVPDWPPDPPPEIYIVDITLHCLLNPIPNGDSVTLWSRDDIQTIKPSDKSTLAWFLYQHVPFFSAALRIRDGAIIPSPDQRGSQYVRNIPSGFTSRFIREALSTIRLTSALGTIDLIKNHSIPTNLPATFPSPPWKPLVEILKVFEFDRHYEDYVALACAALFNGNIDEARGFKQKALKGIRGDQGLDEDTQRRFAEGVENTIPEDLLNRQAQQSSDINNSAPPAP